MRAWAFAPTAGAQMNILSLNGTCLLLTRATAHTYAGSGSGSESTAVTSKGQLAV